jgi:hypothetical protein
MDKKTKDVKPLCDDKTWSCNQKAWRKTDQANTCLLNAAENAAGAFSFGILSGATMGRDGVIPSSVQNKLGTGEFGLRKFVEPRFDVDRELSGVKSYMVEKKSVKDNKDEPLFRTICDSEEDTTISENDRDTPDALYNHKGEPLQYAKIKTGYVLSTFICLKRSILIS